MDVFWGRVSGDLFSLGESRFDGIQFCSGCSNRGGNSTTFFRGASSFGGSGGELDGEAIPRPARFIDGDICED